jgi:hypothetical protein
MALNNVQHYDSTAMDAANEYTPMFMCTDFQYCRVTFVSASSANATVKLYGSWQEIAPTLASAASGTNQLATVWFTNSDTPWTVVDGDTGVAWSWTDAQVHVVVDCAWLRWLGALMTARSAGNVTVYFDFFNKN